MLQVRENETSLRKWSDGSAQLVAHLRGNIDQGHEVVFLLVFHEATLLGI